jgi:hypothetical protein
MYRTQQDATWFNNQWVDIHLTSIVPIDSQVHQYRFVNDDTSLSGKYLLAYVTDFQIVKGAVPNNGIKQLALTGGGFFVQGG